MSRRWDEAAGVVTPEAVELRFAEANVGSRAVAWFIDAFLLTLAMVALNLLIGMLGPDADLPQWVGITVLVVLNFLLFFGYPIGFETLLRGKTPGKAALGLRVVTVEGAPIAFRHAAIRAALGLVDFFLTSGVAAVLSALLSKRHQRLGDMVAATVVLRERHASPPPSVTTFRIPDGAESYATTIDVSGLSARDYEAVREFLLRMYTLRPEPRADIGRRLADGIASKLHHERPRNISPELFLTAVAARYQERTGRTAPPTAPAVAPAPVPPGARAGDAPSAAPPADVPPPAAPDGSWGDFAPPR